MKLHELYNMIALQDEIIQRLDTAAAEVSLESLSPWLEQLQDSRTASQAYSSLQALLEEDEDNIKMLYCQLECARRVHHSYRELQINDTVYRDTMKCFSRFIDECGKKNGRLFFDRGWWTYRQISMQLFRIGSLEYEFPAGEEKIISLHIPSDADLSREAVSSSLEEADTFFRTRYPDYRYDRYICSSWLMSPVLRSLLPESSNIIAFQNRFSILSETEEDSGCLDWLFGCPGCTDYDTLPEDTRLQKNAKKLLLSGGHIGAASGILYRKIQT